MRDFLDGRRKIQDIEAGRGVGEKEPLSSQAFEFVSRPIIAGALVAVVVAGALIPVLVNKITPKAQAQFALSTENDGTRREAPESLQAQYRAPTPAVGVQGDPVMQEELRWIKENPEQVRRMLENSSQSGQQGTVSRSLLKNIG